MMNLLKSSVSVVLLLCSWGTVLGADAPKTKILLIGKNPDHPYGSHMYMHTCTLLARCLEKAPGVTTIVSNGWPKDAATLEGVQAIVLYCSPAAEFLLEGPQREQVDRLMKSGIGLVTIHWASSVTKNHLDRLGPTWLSYLGGTWVSNVGLSSGKSALKQLVPEHPICRGWSEYEIEDEYYLDPVLGKKTTALLQVRERTGKDVIVGWAYERPDGGRAFGTTLGHPYKNFQVEAFRRMLANAILWSAHREVPTSGASVQVGNEILALPPQKE
jgi:type 1 glutamine amidotransferase